MNTVIPETNFHYLDSKERFKILAALTWSRFKKSWSIFIGNKLAVLGLTLLCFYLLMAILHPILLRTIWPKKIYDPVVGHDLMIFPHPSMPSRAHLLGTDTLGRDVLSILMAATAPSLQIALAAAITAAIVGTFVGSISAYFRGYVDGFFTHFADIVLLAPAPLVMVVIGFMLDIDPLQFGFIYGLMVGMSSVAVVLRSHALTIMNRTFIQAARVAGGGSIHIVMKHLVPHMLPLAAVNMLLTVTGVIFAAGFIAFLGLSRAQLNWGSMIYDSFTYQSINGVIAWNVLIPSSMAISLFAASFYFIALGLHDVVEPRLADRPAPRLRKEKARKEDKISDAKIIAGLEGISGSLSGINVTIMAVRFHNTLVKSHVDRKVGEVFSESGLIKSAEYLVEKYGGEIAERKEGSLLVRFGLLSHMPARASALLATDLGLKYVEMVNNLNDSLNQNSQNYLKVSIGIASGRIINIQRDNLERSKDFDAEKIRRTARVLEYFGGLLVSGGVLINESAYISLSAVRHHFQFGRSGMVEIPGIEGKKMIYQIIGRHE